MTKIDLNHSGLESSINELLGEPILSNSLESCVLGLTAVVADLDMANKKGVTADHRRLLVWKAGHNARTVLALLDKVSKCHSVGKETNEHR